MSTIEERIAKHEVAIKKLTPIKERQEKLLAKTKGKLEYHWTAVQNLTLKKKTGVSIPPTYDPIGDILVESGAITEAQRQEIEKLPEPEGRIAQRVPREAQ